MKNRSKPPLVLFVLPLIFLIGLLINWGELSWNTNLSDPFSKFESVTKDTLPFSQYLGKLGTAIKYNTGESLQDGVFISDQGLMKALPPVNDEVKTENGKEVLALGRSLSEDDTTLYFTLIPSASGVMQQRLPTFSSTINQKNTIDNIYNQFAGEVGTINVYNTLIENNNKYIYYRTEDALTPLGGYYTYTELVRRMLVAGDIIPLNRFGVTYSSKDYYGSLYSETPHAKVSPDVLSYYKYVGNRDHHINHLTYRGLYSYRDFYSPTKDGLNSYLGGGSGGIEIFSQPAPELRLLLLGDETAISYLPFLSNHYSQITFANLYDNYYGIDVDNLGNYDQILIAVGLENYTQKKIEFSK